VSKTMNSFGILLVVIVTSFGRVAAQSSKEAPTGKPAASVDLATTAGVKLVQGQWRYSDTKIIEVENKKPAADGKSPPTTVKTYDIIPHAEPTDFDDSKWEVIGPETLGQKRSTGKVCFNWYRIRVTLPDKVGDVEMAGSTVVFEVVVDDYGEVWVDGKLPREIGQRGGAVVSGFNAPNRLVIAKDAKPGQKIQLAVFGINGPISASPNNFIFIRSAKLEFYKP